MSKLQAAIASFVEELLRVLREAPLAELGALTRTSQRPPQHTPQRTGERAPREMKRAAHAAKPRAAAAAVTSRRAAPSARAPHAPRVKTSPASPRRPEPPPSAEITDPESLLGVVLEPVRAPAPALPLPPALEEPPPSATRTSVTFSARADESIVRVSNGGVVIRRSSRG